VETFRTRFAGRDDVLAGVFGAGELEYCQAQRRPWPHLAARFAAKEATFKALGSGLAGAMSWQDVQVVRDEAGTPRLHVAGETARRLAGQDLEAGAVSLAHAGEQAIAVVLLVPRRSAAP
jgi:holo-[acyl-carrier protein] synthase